MFQWWGKRIYRVIKSWSYLGSNQQTYKLSFDKTSLKLAINYLLDSCYFTLGGMCFGQLIGIPMGSDPFPFMVNLFLYYHGRKWLLRRKKQNLWKTWIISIFFRFIDDLCIFNNNEFESNYNDVRSDELELKEENEDPCKASVEPFNRSLWKEIYHWVVW